MDGIANPEPIFLTAEWRHLAMLNYEVEAAALAPHVPAGTELDRWDGRALVSVVGFQFLQTRVRGWPIPFHRHFEEVNLRFYVRRRAAEGWRRGVVFLKEIVPRAAIAWTAQKFYNEPYVAWPMRHEIRTTNGQVSGVTYAWEAYRCWHSLRLETAGAFQPLAAGSEAEFITEHYWGYNRQRNGSTLEYQVEHPCWRVVAASLAKLDCDIAAVYGAAFRASLAGPPISAFLAEGSTIVVRRGLKITS
ncbi:MAG TPA: DUF2071 domain-containing protein [Dongiaceae bacterium]|nr:DUF2071 domain-containing protein [Dongiaceae bacterium]